MSIMTLIDGVDIGRRVDTLVDGIGRVLILPLGRGQYKLGISPVVDAQRADAFVGRPVAWSISGAWLVGQAYLGKRPGPKPSQPMQRITIWIPSATVARYDAQSVPGLVTRSELMRAALMEWIGKTSPPNL